jgi:protein-S-isoprenylcysteine O-methyltransferase Ste14
MAVWRPLPPVVLLLSSAVRTAAHVWWPVATLVRFPVSLAGLLPIGCGVCLNLAADALLTRHQTTVKPFQPSTRLVTTGVYGRTRHPMYLGFVLIQLGLAVLLGSLGPLAVVAGFAVLMDHTYVRVEEAMLRERFGSEWRRYEAAVRRWV